MEQIKKELPYKSLVIGCNMRTVKPSAQKDKGLIATIRAVGVIQNLVVAKIPNTDKYAVGAGGRRYSSVGYLIEQNDTMNGEPVTEDTLLPVLEVPYDKLEECSLIENHDREGAHPADQFMAFYKLYKNGNSIEQIAATFGIPKSQVKKLLKLGSVAPKLVEIYKSGKLSLEAVMAFTIADDHERQLACYEALKDDPDEYYIRQYLTDKFMRSTDSLVKFVGLANYTKAGGATAGDMFDDITYVANPEIVMELADKKLERAAKKAGKGWKWVETAHSHHSACGFGRVVPAGYIDLPVELDEQIKALDAEWDKLNYKDVDEWSEQDYKRDDELRTLVRELEEKRESYKGYTDEQRATCGVVVYVNREGKAATLTCVIRPEDEPLLNPDEGEASSEESPHKSTQQLESGKLGQDLDCYYHQAFMAEMLNHEQMAFDVLVYSMAQTLASKGGNRISNIYCESDRLTGIEEEGTQAQVLLDQAKAALPLDWLEISGDAERFQAFQSLTSTDKRRIMTYCVASSIRNPVRSKANELSVIRDAVAFDLSNYWQPTKENYFSRLKKKDLLKIGGEVEGDQWIDDHAKWKAGALCDLLPELDSMKGWIPPYFKR